MKVYKLLKHGIFLEFLDHGLTYIARIMEITLNMISSVMWHFSHLCTDTFYE